MNRLPDLFCTFLSQALGIQDYFDLVLTSKECGMEKPARQIFDIALTRVGVYDRSGAVHVGSHFGFDVEGAAGAGWHALYVKPPPLSDRPANPDKLPYQRCALHTKKTTPIRVDLARSLSFRCFISAPSSFSFIFTLCRCRFADFARVLSSMHERIFCLFVFAPSFFHLHQVWRLAAVPGSFGPGA